MLDVKNIYNCEQELRKFLPVMRKIFFPGNCSIFSKYPIYEYSTEVYFTNPPIFEVSIIFHEKTVYSDKVNMGRLSELYYNNSEQFEKWILESIGDVLLKNGIDKIAFTLVPKYNGMIVHATKWEHNISGWKYTGMCEIKDCH